MKEFVFLMKGPEDFIGRFFAPLPLFEVVNDADDGGPWFASSGPADAFPDGALAGPIALGGRFIDDGNGLGSLAVFGSKTSASGKSRADGFKVAGFGDAPDGAWCFARLRRR